MRLILSLITGAAAAAALFHILFEDKEEFYDCVKFWLKPDVISLFRGESLEDMWAEFKLLAWAGSSWLAGHVVYAWLS